MGSGRGGGKGHKGAIEDPERVVVHDDLLLEPAEVKASEAHLELMELFREDADYQGCKYSEFLVYSATTGGWSRLQETV